MRRGVALLQALLIAAMLSAIAVAVMKWQLQRHQLSAKASTQSRLTIDLDGAKSALNSCLAAAGYPSGSCQPSAAQAACVPSGVTASFSGNPPDCEVKLTVTR